MTVQLHFSQVIHKAGEICLIYLQVFRENWKNKNEKGTIQAKKATVNEENGKIKVENRTIRLEFVTVKIKNLTVNRKKVPERFKK